MARNLDALCCCCSQVSTLSVTCGAKDWQLGLEIAKEEVTRLVEHGLTQAEYDCFMESTLKDCDLQAKQRDSVPSSKVVQLLMDMAMLRYARDPRSTGGALRTVTLSRSMACAR